MLAKLAMSAIAVIGLAAQPAFARDSETAELHSSVLEENRRFTISLPANYANSDQDYPVMFVLDGESHTEHLRQAVNIRYQMGYPDVILVGVETVDRGRDFTFVASEEAPTGGGADRFLEFLADEALPFVEQNYRTSGHTALFGHSAGGLFAGYAMVHEPDAFDAYIVVSPTLRWGEFGLVEPLRAAVNEIDDSTRVYLSWGDETGLELQGFEIFQRILENAPASVSVEIAPDTTESHDSIPYLAGFKGIRAIYAPFALPDDVAAGSLDGLVAYYETVGSEFGVDGRPPQRVLLDRGFGERAAGNAEDAIATFTLFADLYPGNPLPLVQLAASHEAAGDLETALATYQRSANIMIWPPDLPDRIARLEAALADE